MLQANAALTQQLADHNHLLVALREETAELAGQLSSAQASVAAKDKLIQQLKAMVGTGDAAGVPWLFNTSTSANKACYTANSSHTARLCEALMCIRTVAWFLQQGHCWLAVHGWLCTRSADCDVCKRVQGGPLTRTVVSRPAAAPPARAAPPNLSAGRPAEAALTTIWQLDR